jgi:hypothetical protein
MRRLFAAAALCAALLLPAAAAFGAPPAHVGDGHHPPRSDDPLTADDAGALSAKRTFAPVGARLSSGTATVFGHLVDSYGTPRSGAWVEAWSEVGDVWSYVDTKTAPDGFFSITNAIPTSNGEVWAYPDDDSALARSAGAWASGGSYGHSLYPGRIAVTGHRGGRWGDFDEIAVRLWGDTTYSKGVVHAGDETSTPVTGNVEVLNGNYWGGSAKFFWDEGVEFYGSVNVVSGSTSGSLTVNEADAQRVWLASPYWYSGKPGATVKLAREGFDAGWLNRVTGYTDDPAGTASKVYGTWQSSGPAAQYKSVKIPAAAKPGYGYWIGLQHVDASGNSYPLYLEELYQVCTLKASKTKVTRGARIRVKGVVPTEGHWGKEKGKAKVVTLYAHKGTAKVPTKWNPKGQGWVKVGSVRTNGYGAYVTPYFKPLKTLTLVVRYPGDDWYWDAYTSTQKITVR